MWHGKTLKLQYMRQCYTAQWMFTAFAAKLVLDIEGFMHVRRVCAYYPPKSAAHLTAACACGGARAGMVITGDKQDTAINHTCCVPMQLYCLSDSRLAMRARAQVWMTTGDKQEMVINIAVACPSHFTARLTAVCACAPQVWMITGDKQEMAINIAADFPKAVWHCAPMQVWMITGDKQETAISIAVACRLVHHAKGSAFLPV